MRILGIDPGIRNTGWGVVARDGASLVHFANGVIQPDPKLPDADRLAVIATGLASVVEAYRPDSAAIEKIFVARSAAAALKSRLRELAACHEVCAQRSAIRCVARWTSSFLSLRRAAFSRTVSPSSDSRFEPARGVRMLVGMGAGKCALHNCVSRMRARCKASRAEPPREVGVCEWRCARLATRRTAVNAEV